VRTVIIILTGCLLAIAAGCDNGRASLTKEINTLRQDKTQLTDQIEQSKSDNAKLREHILFLPDLSPKARLEYFDRLQRIKIPGYTNLYDKDKDGKKEKLIVHIQPIDRDGDIIKTAGSADVQLWDLNSPQANQALLGQWHVEPNDLKKLWSAKFLTTSYRLMFDVANKVESFEEPLTVKVTFTDYLTGKVFKEQKVIKP